MRGSAEGSAGEPGQVDPSAGPLSTDPLFEERAKQANKLTAAAGTLRKAARRLRNDLPPNDEHPMAFWQAGLDTMKGHLQEVDTLHEDCELVVRQISEAKQAADTAALATAGDESKPNGVDADQMELDALSEGLTQLGEAIARAAKATRKAIAAVYGRSTDDKREDAYFEAAGELAGIADRCQGLGKQLAGEAALPGSGAVPRSLSTRLPGI